MSRKIVPALEGRTVRCILFDLGNTLWTYKDRAMRNAAEKIAQQQAITILRSHVDPHSFPKIDDTALVKQLFEIIEQQMYAIRPHMRIVPDITSATVEALQTLGFPKVERRVGEEVYEALRDSIPETRVLFEDAIPTLATLQKRGFLLNIVSNRSYGGLPFRAGMREIGLQEYFDPQKIAISIDVGSNKPDSYIFQYALDALNVAPEEAVMVGDSLGADVVGAKRLDIFAIWKPTPRLFEKARAKAHMHNLSSSSASEHLIKDMFKKARKREEKKGRPVPADLKPDLIIEHLSELLDVFVEVGKQ
ncbi:MAG: hypothetical protein NVS4B12_19070 [Ktedonobacteraceae bacterium]